MKKMLSTIVVAVAFAMVSTVDAKVMKKRGSTASQKINNIVAAAADLVEEPMAATPTSVQQALSEQNLTEDEREYAVLEFQLLDTNNRIAFRSEQLKDLKLGMFGGLFTATKEQREEGNRLTNIINKLKADKKQIEADMATLKPVVGDKFTKAIKLFAVGVVTTLVGSVAYTVDQKYFGGKYSEKVGTFVNNRKNDIEQFGTNVSNKINEKKAAFQEWYNAKK